MPPTIKKAKTFNYSKAYTIKSKQLNTNDLKKLMDMFGKPYKAEDSLETLQRKAKPVVEQYNTRVFNRLKFEAYAGVELPSAQQTWVEWGKDMLNKLGLKAVSKDKYEYLGAGTPLTRNIMNGVRPINHLDDIAKQHDIDYLMIGKLISEGANKEMIEHHVRDADEKFLNAIKEAEAAKGTMWGFQSDDESRTAQQAADWIHYKMKNAPVDFSIVPVKPLNEESKKKRRIEVSRILKMMPDIIHSNEVSLTPEESRYLAEAEAAEAEEDVEAREKAAGDAENQREIERQYLEADEKEREEKIPEAPHVGEAHAELIRGKEKKAFLKSVPIKLAGERQTKFGHIPSLGGRSVPDAPVAPETAAQKKARYAAEKVVIDATHAEQVKEENEKREAMRLQYRDTVITGERSMRPSLTFLGADFVKLTPDEKARNIAFYSSLNFVKEGHGAGNQEILPFSYDGWAPNNRLYDLQAVQQQLQYSGHLNNGNSYVPRHKHPSQETLHKFEAVMMPSGQNMHNQQWMPTVATTDPQYQKDTIGKDIQFAHRETRPTMYNNIYSKNTRLYHANVVNGDPFAKNKSEGGGVRV